MLGKVNDKINLVYDYVYDNALLVSRDLKIPMDKAIEYVNDIISDYKANGLYIDPTVTYIGKNQFGDNVEKRKPLTAYLNATASGIVVPSGTVYTSHDKEMSIHTENTGNRVMLRSKVKKEGALAELQGNKREAVIKDTFQKAYKNGNNSITGLFDNMFNPFYRPSSHYSLTSMTATETSIGNSISESMVAGNRLYTRPEVVIDHILSTATNTDISMLEKVIKKYNLYIPTIDDCMYIILKSTRFYWSSNVKDDEIRYVLSNLTDIERSAFAYVNDLYHLRYYNKDFVRDMFDKLLVVNEVDDYNKAMSGVEEDIEILSRCILYDDIIEYSKRDEAISFKDDKFPEVKRKIAGVARNIADLLLEYDDLISTLFRSNNMPINVSDIKQMVRKCTILSDTDSTCSTYQDWVMWYHNRRLPKFSSDEIGISNLVLLFTYRTLAHSLMSFSKRMNVKGKYLKLLAMKNEFYWKAMIFTNMTKHYYADTAIKEGAIFKKTKLELKGSLLIDSKLPRELKELSETYYKRILETVTSGNIINLHDLVHDIVNIELDLMERASSLDADMMKEEIILAPESYKLKDKDAKYLHLLLWNEVFGPKYGAIDSAPVVCIKIKTIMTSKKSMMDGLSEISDTGIRDRFIRFVEKHNKSDLETMRLPKDVVLGIGIPDELEHLMSTRPLILELCRSFYTILETTGFYKKPDKLLSDLYPHIKEMRKK